MDRTRLRKLTLIGAAAAALAVLSVIRIPPPGPPVRPLSQRPAMPDFTYPALSGDSWQLSQQRGRIVFVNFWATWCAPCREETPGFVRLHRRFRDSVEFAGVSMDDDPREAVPPFARRYTIEYPMLIAPPDAPLVNAVEVLPTSFLVDSQGRIARAWTGAVREADLSAAIEALLKEKS